MKFTEIFWKNIVYEQFDDVLWNNKVIRNKGQSLKKDQLDA